MKNEIRSATDFLSNLLRAQNVSADKIENFRTTLQNVMTEHYLNHWFPETPCKGSGYRCLRINYKMDPLIKQAAESCGVSMEMIRQLLPKELTMWVDPREVAYRIGENGSIGMLYQSDLPHVMCQKQKSQISSPVQSQSGSHNSHDENSYSCKGQFLNSLPRDNLKQLAAAFVSS
ncbi:protein BTG2-like [Gigantopelta aegis]|uniref:protein BTG2-like n=1 Tax=Gigantopelta aegis TaxID=1735272 RepID=UPI001B8875AA|nr:protein BTG2-like [Gigantopelta aegis]